MLSAIEAAAHRYSAYAKEVIEPAVHPATVPVAASAFQCAEPVTVAEAARAEFRPVAVGWRWGPAWSTAWFRVRGRVPAGWSGRTVALRFSSGTEALLWEGGLPVQGFDENRDRHVLLDPAAGDEPVDLLIEAACNRPHGATLFWWDPAHARERWTGDTPGCLERCELALFDPAAWRLWVAYDFAQQMLSLLPADHARVHAISAGLGRATRCLDDTNVAAGAAEATAILAEAWTADDVTATRCFAVGHAHIDTAWLWPIRETRRKCLRSFANTLRLMERFPDFGFLCSQPQQYAWVEADAPALFAEITERVATGRWEVSGAMWIEPDCNVPSGESLVRQLLHGLRYCRERFGDDAPQRVLYLPDTFGFPATLPQIMAGAGLDTFVTNKLSWSETNEFPFVSFRWRGLDGTEVLAHCTPGHDYNATNSALELRRGAANMARLDRGRTDAWLQPFGHGDGGGGSTDAMIERARLAGAAAGLPRVKLAGMEAFRAALHERHAALTARGDDLPVWDGELYLELHRGTYTTCGWLKRANRDAEHALRRVEWLAWGGPHPLPADEADDLRERLDEAWKLVLLNQFHDILPGTSVPSVYEDARVQHERVQAFARDAEAAGLARWAAAADTSGLARPMLVLNPGSAPRSGVVSCDGERHYVGEVPALGALVVDRATPTPAEPVRVAGRTMTNGLLEVTIDDAGRLASLRRLADGREAGAPGTGGSPRPLNQLVLYEDRPRSWEAWDIDAEHAEKPSLVDGPAKRIDVVEDGPLRGAIEMERPLGRDSHIRQRYVLEAGCPCVAVETRVEWHERRRLLRALFPLAVRTPRATYEIQFGHVERPTHRNTTWEQAMFEVCAHAWADVSEPGFGVALLNDGKYGHSCEGSVLGLSLLRGPEFPAPGMDRGEHEFTYALMPHGGDWRAEGVDRAAHTLNDPLRAVPLPAGQSGEYAGVSSGGWAPLALDGAAAAGIVVAALKRAENDDRVVVRLVETHGRRGPLEVRWRLPVTGVQAVDLLERPVSGPRVERDDGARRTAVTVRPFEIVTLAASLKTGKAPRALA